MKRILFIITAITLLSVYSNCQWYVRKYGVTDPGQLSQEQLTKELRKRKILISYDVAVIITGTLGIIAGSNLINRSHEEELIEVTSKSSGVLLISAGVICDITGLLFLKKLVSQSKEIKKVLAETDINIGIINYSPGPVSEALYTPPVPAISVTFHF